MWSRRWWRNRFRVSPAQVIGAMESRERPVFLDVRTAQEYEASPLKLPGAIRVSPEEIGAGPLDLKLGPQQPLVVYCASLQEQTSARVTAVLRQRGYRNVLILKGGLGGWTNAGLPVETKSHLPAIGIEVYKSLTAGDLKRRAVPSGEFLFREGDEADDEAYVVHSGQVEIRKRFELGERVVRVLSEGEMIGEMALLRKAPRSASAVAVTDVNLIVIKAEQLDWLIRNRPEFTLAILRRMGDWVAVTTAQAVAAPDGQAAASPPGPSSAQASPSVTPQVMPWADM
jgi:rhodanese-related sulfurtransferase